MSGDRRAAPPALLAHAAAFAGGALLLLAVGQPIFTDDLWWHLALGRGFRAGGPWLDADPLLAAAAGPPSPASWWSDVALFELSRAGGFAALRALHAAAVAAILAAVWAALQRASRSPILASTGTLAFAALAAYRLVQLRPELVTIACALALWRLVLVPRRPLSARHILAFAGLSLLWVNAHAAFPLALLLPAAAIAGLLCAAPWRDAASRDLDRARARRLALALVAAGAATLVNPLGPRAHLAYLVAGGPTPALERVSDEWSPVSLFSLPTPAALPTPLAWVLAWAIGLGLALVLARAIRDARGAHTPSPDPALLGASLAAFALMLAAVRFLWLGVLPLLLFAAVLAPRPGASPRARWVIAGAAPLLLAAFLAFGTWPKITRGLPATWSDYAQPYQTGKYHAHAVWLLRDSDLRGTLHCDYSLGGFAGYWLAPEIRTVVNGSLNVPRGTLDAIGALALRRGERADEDFPALLERLGVDLFLGTRLPLAGADPRALVSTTGHLEGVPGWIPVFRNLSSALYLRADARGRENVTRLARWYAAQGVPFDATRGFDAGAVIERAGGWAFRHGMVPPRFARLAHVARHSDAPRDRTARSRAAIVYAVLGLYGNAIAIDRRSLQRDPGAVAVRRRLAWSLLRTGAYPEAAAVAAPLTSQPEADGLSHLIERTAREVLALDAASARARVALLPLLTRAEAHWLLVRTPTAPARPALD